MQRVDVLGLEVLNVPYLLQFRLLLLLWIDCSTLSNSPVSPVSVKRDSSSA